MSIPSTPSLSPLARQDRAAMLREQFEPIRPQTIGPMVMGIFADAVFCGILLVQVTHWVQWSKSEKWFTKGVVAFCLIITIGTTLFNLAFGFNDLVYGFGKYANLMSVKYVSWYRILDCFAAAGTQIFFVERAGKLSGWPKTIWSLMTPVIVGACAASITNFVVLRHNVETGTNDLNGDPALTTWIAATVCIDAVLSIIIIYNLVKSKTGWASTDAAIKRLIRVSLEASVPATLLAISFLLAFELRGDTRIPVFFDLCIGKIYVVCLMSLLNAKINLKRDVESASQVDSFFGETGVKIKQAAVMVSTEVYTESHQMQRLPGLNAPKRAPVARKTDEESSIDGEVIDIDLDLGQEGGGSRVDVRGTTGVRFQDMVKV